MLLLFLDCKEPLLDWELDLVELDLVELDFCLDFYQKIQSCQFCG